MIRTGLIRHGEKRRKVARQSEIIILPDGATFTPISTSNGLDNPMVWPWLVKPDFFKNPGPRKPMFVLETNYGTALPMNRDEFARDFISRCYVEVEAESVPRPWWDPRGWF
jgi:hypothetical protein